jgi:hypothetical protein
MAVTLIAEDGELTARNADGVAGAMPYCPLPCTLIRKLIIEGSDELALEVYRRLCADRLSRFGDPSSGAPSWTAIARAAEIEGLFEWRA